MLKVRTFYVVEVQVPSKNYLEFEIWESWVQSLEFRTNIEYRREILERERNDGEGINIKNTTFNSNYLNLNWGESWMNGTVSEGTEDTNRKYEESRLEPQSKTKTKINYKICKIKRWKSRDLHIQYRKRHGESRRKNIS